MKSYTVVGIAHVELLLVPSLRRKTLQAIKTPPASVSSIRLPVAKVSLALGRGRGEDHRARPWIL
jgi:hypothetical protein